ncbi:PREDICTED: UDP-glycosyltransferase 91C1 [Fragaria vesca subsp. vesca]|uniref:UDP-glycosyltransferase 91C1 n=1 Tax=Fragaria vesca subsp. vesca TaxID=101020 RepID=UPI0002C33C23|nr:PREDICTED: UDP-glycosyltransferase 91C1 [Fragaria vesca subsp. vesca]
MEEQEKEKEKQRLHLVVFPWLAMGHLIPFFHLSKLIAQKGHKVSFISTPRNLQRLPKIPPHSSLSSLITLVPLPLPHVENLPDDAESSNDVPYNKQQLLKKAFDLLESPMADFLESSAPDWVVYDYASHWLPPLAAKLGVSRAYFCLFTAACMAVIGPPSLLIDGQDKRTKTEDFTVVSPWIPFKSDMAFRYHEVAKYVHENESGTPDTVRFGIAVRDSDVVLMRSSEEFEPEWFELLRELYGRSIPVLPVGFLPPLVEEKPTRVKDWLDEQRVNSVVYVALGTEATLSQGELTELALGLERSGLPFFWVLRDPPESTRAVSEMLPDGFLERVRDRGMVHFGWAPQVWILSHDSVGGFLTHCGWNSMIEGLGFGKVLILFPMLNDQGLNARLANGKGLGVEIPRNELDGSFTRDAVAEFVRLAMVEEEGEMVRRRVKEIKGIFGDRNRNSRLENEFICFLEENRPNKLA